MFSHVMVGTNDLERSKRFYDAVLGVLGAPEGMLNEDRRIFYMTPTGMFSATKPIDGEPASPGNGGTVAFVVDSPEQAAAWHAAGVANGGATCEDPPGVRESAMGPLYLAYMRDPDGNKLCAIKRM